MLNDNLEAFSTPADVLNPSRAETAHPPITAGIIEREEEGTLILAPANGAPYRRVIFVNSYGGAYFWERIKKGLEPPHHLWGCLELVRMGYEVALAEPLRHFCLYRRPFPHDLKLLHLACNWLRAGDIIYCGHTLLYWLPVLKTLGALNRHLVSLTYAREELDFSRTHSGIIALTPTAADQARKMAPKTKVAHLGWGVDLSFYPKLPYRPDHFLSCGITLRDNRTLSLAASRSDSSIRIICPQRPKGITWPANVELIETGRGIRTDEKEVSYHDLLHDHYARATACLVILNYDSTQYTCVGFTNLIEAMAMARPVIFTRTGAAPSEIDVEKAGCGLHVPPDEPAALADAIQGLANDPVRAEAMGRRGRELCENHYNINRFARDLHQFFESL
jgi:glycosyltransferase involved in cell wall biosynthesis